MTVMQYKLYTRNVSISKHLNLCRCLNIKYYFVDRYAVLNIVRKNKNKKSGHKVELNMQLDGTQHSVGWGG